MLRLQELKLIDHPVLGNLSLDLFEKGDSVEGLYTTVLIGPNGTGKSFILQSIVNIFREAACFIMDNKRSGAMKGSFYLRYALDQDILEIANINFDRDKKLVFQNAIAPEDKVPLIYKVNGIPTREFKYLPNRILASTMIFADKLPAVIDTKLPQYRYLGLRNINAPSTSGTRGIDIKLVDSLTDNLSKPGFVDSLIQVLNRLKYNPSVTISYTPKYRSVFYSKNLKVDDFIGMFNNWQITFRGRKSIPWGKTYFDSIAHRGDLLAKLVHFLNTKQFLPRGRGGRYFQYELLREGISHEDYDVLFHLRKLDLISFPTIQLHKERSDFDFSDSSTGEQNVLFSLLTMMGNIDNNSIILIDEPELSLHPNWQMQYFTILKDVFRSYKDIHFVVATHSHFLISDLQGEGSNIIGLKRDDKIEIVDLPKNLNTFGWSSEDVLYNIFNVRSSLNYYLEADLTELLGMISNGIKKPTRIVEILEKLNKLPKRENDPLQEIILEAQEYLSSIK